MGRSIDEEIKEKAFQLWRKNGQSPTKVVRMLQEQGHAVTRQTIDAWMNDPECDWKGRAARADAVEQQAKDPELTGEERMIAALTRQAQRYEEYFDTLTVKSMDSQAVYAYTNLITTIQSIRQKTAAYRAEVFLDFLKELIDWLAKNDPDSVVAIEKNFDDFALYAKERYGKR